MQFLDANIFPQSVISLWVWSHTLQSIESACQVSQSKKKKKKLAGSFVGAALQY